MNMFNDSVILKKVPNVEPGELGQMLQGLRSDILKDVDTKLQRSIVKIVNELEAKQRKHQNGFIEKSVPAKETGGPKELPIKQFSVRCTALETLLGNPDMQSLFNCVYAVFVLIYLYMAIFYYFNVERFKKDIDMICWTFSKFHIVTAVWLGINFSIVFILYPVFRFWATNRTFIKIKGIYDSVFCALFILYEAALYIIPAAVTIAYNTPPISSLIILTEQSRLFMKSYAFVRENIPRAVKYKPHQDGDKEDPDSSPCPKVDKLIYFLFVPTLVYRDNYPRTSRIRWSRVAHNFRRIIQNTLPYYVAFMWFSVHAFNKAGFEPIPFSDLIGALIQSIFAGSIVMFFAFYSTLHTIQDFVGEILRFGDRRFYEDWWNCTSFADFFRSWNLIVHDWLYSYVYRDVYIILGRSRTAASLTVFLISAVLHEYILAVFCKFLFPLLFALFVIFAVPLVFITRKKTSRFWNIFLWFSLLQGYAVMLAFYTIEWYARVNCPRILDSWQDYFVPRIFYCNVISWPF